MFRKQTICAVLAALALFAQPSWAYTNDEAWRLYLDVCQFGSKEEMERFFNLYSIDVNTKDPETDLSGIEYAAKSNFHPDAVQYLIDRGANSENKSKALVLAIENNCTEVVQLIEKSGAKLDKDNAVKYGDPLNNMGSNTIQLTRSDLIEAIKSNGADIIKRMLVNGVSVSSKEDWAEDNTLLYFIERIGDDSKDFLTSSNMVSHKNFKT